ncbi:SDR family NAD(P)-dependent oxidoreductase [Streptomyces sp. NPDC048669]|uniref:type I polyketide synthase n=1 Tax=Streptomyces sp. NPDC048669 TaxID=3155267 RepID=UPI00343C3563
MNNEDKLRDYLRRVTAELRSTRQRLRDVEERSAGPVAIVGMACHYPGGVASADDLWSLVAEGRDGITPFPADRGWDLDALHHPDPDHPGTTTVDQGGFLHDAAAFDAGFFGISPKEALHTDPQQRLILQTSWEAVERAGLDPSSLRESRTGVFTGVMHHDYPGAQGAGSVVSGRVAYQLGLRGPAITLDTACSSSLVALHLAVRSLRRGECDMALVGGAAVMATPAAFVEFSRQRGLAHDGRCKPFAAAADGTAWSEGVGVIVVERLATALAAGHRVLAVVRGTAVNSDGASNGLTAPNGPAQQRVIREALVDAGLAPEQVDAVEAHGTGTPLGDPVEAQAVLAAYGGQRARPLRLGSVKSNLGHTQAAAGVAGIVKMVMAMRHGVLPRTLHLDAPTPYVDWSSGAVELLAENVPWPAGKEPRRAAVSSFGVSGTNAHVILEEPPVPVDDGQDDRPMAVAHAVEAADATGGTDTTDARATADATDATDTTDTAEAASAVRSLASPAGPGPAPLAWTLSARSDAALRAQATTLTTFLTGLPQEPRPEDVALSLATTRASHEHRAVVLGADRSELLAGLADLAAGRPSPAVVEGTTGPSGGVAFLFPGQGSQWRGMAVRLLDTSTVFRERIEQCEAALAPFVDFELTEVLRGGEDLDRVDVVQPALFAVMVSLAEVWRSLGIQPAAVAGHSQGEIAAACVAGALTLEDAARVVALRSRALTALSGRGGMMSVALPSGEARSRLQDWDGRLSLAAVNGETSVVVSGDTDALDELLAACEEEGVRARRVDVDYASHSAHVETVRTQVLEALAPVSPRTPEIPFFSSVEGRWIDAGDAFDADYWYRNLRETVRFDEAVTALVRRDCTTLLEVSPHPVVTTGAQETVDALGTDTTVAHTLRRDEGGPEQLVHALAQLYVKGVRPDWSALWPGARRTDLPTTTFVNESYWMSADHGGGGAGALGLDDIDHPVLRAALPAAEGAGGTVLTGRLGLSAQPWLADHTVEGQVVLPGAALAELTSRAADETGCAAVDQLTLLTPVVLPEAADVRLRIDVTAPADDGSRGLTLHTLTGAGHWTTHATAVLLPDAVEPPADTTAWPPAGAEPQDVDALYATLEEAGLDYGPAFRGVRALWRGRDGDLHAEVALPGTDHADGFTLHPALLDACLHPIAVGGFLTTGEGGRPALPFEWQGLRIHASGADTVRVTLSAAGPDGVRLAITDTAGAPVASVDTLVLRELPAGALGRPDRGDLLCPRQVARTLPEGVREDYVVRDPELARQLGQQPTEDLARHVLVPAPAGEPGEAVRAALSLVHEWLADEGHPDSTLVLVTRRIHHDVAEATVAGLVRSAQLEHPGSFRLLDLADLDEATLAAIPAALATDEPQLTLAAGTATVPRLVRDVPAPGGNGVIGRTLVTGASGTLGQLVARHLVQKHGVRDLVLAGRRGSEAPGMAELTEELTAAGAEVRAVACDVTDRAALAALADGTSFDTVVHAAGALDDGLITGLTPERLVHVLGAKLGAALHLHELLPQARLVVYSSAVGILGGLGQANYAAANSGLDALARRRHAEGLPGVSLAWGLWDATSGMTDGVDRASLGRSGFRPLPTADALAALDAALVSDEPVLAPIRLDLAALRAQGEEIPAPLRDLSGRPVRRTAATGGGAAVSELAARLAGKTGPERLRTLLDLVVGHTSAVLGHASPEAVDPGRAFKEAGFGSLAAVELRNRLAGVTGLRLPATLVFSHPTPTAVARHLDELLAGSAPAAVPAVRAVAADADDPVVLVGLGCRLPGGVRTPDDLWEMLVRERDGIGPFPDDRGWPLERLYDPDPAAPGSSYTRHGGFMADATAFDAAFFGVAPREAVAMDPQQRVLLETVWEACEDAGIDPTSLRGTRTGVFVGSMYQDYGRLLESAAAEGFLAAGVGGGVLSGRVAYTYGLEGPTVTVDTACSSSLTALHLAAQAVRAGECDLALAGGVTVLATPVPFVEFSRQRGLAADGRCKPFAAAADGTALGEGVGVVLVERLSRARAQGHEVLAVLRGSALNSDGASNGLTAPNGAAQEKVMRAALAAAGLVPSDVAAVEAHGTGTALGDPIEAQAVLAVYGQDRPAPLRLGSLKSNVGHVQAAAGIAGVIKAVLSIRNGLLPRSLHIDEPSPHVDWTAGQVALLDRAQPWPEGVGPRRMGVSSFGISGTNVHVVIEQAPSPTPTGTTAAGDTDTVTDTPMATDTAEPLPALDAVPWLLSARSERALRGQARRLLESDTDDLPAVARALSTTRAHHRHRAMVTGTDAQRRRAALTALADDGAADGLRRARSAGQRLTLLFTGQGSQLPTMGRGLYETFPVYARAFDEVSAHFRLDTGLREAVFERDDLLDRTQYTQPALFALQVAQFRLLSSWGVTPDSLIGHSIGELSAACVSGLLPLADAATLVTARGRVLGELPSGGAMVAVRATEEEVLAVLEGRAGRVDVAAVNGPRSVVLSGDEDEVLGAAQELSERGHRIRRLRVDVAFHSSRVDPALAEFRKVAAGIRFGRPAVPLVSTVRTAHAMDTPDYWVDQLRGSVRFFDAVRQAHENGTTAFLELGPDTVLAPAAETCLPDRPVSSVAFLRRDREDVRTAVEALGLLHTHGVEVDWPAVHAGRPDTLARLPKYAFQSLRCWPEPAAVAAAAPVPEQAPALGLLWSAVEDADLGAALGLLNLRGDESPDQVLAALGRLRSGAEAPVLEGVRWKRMPETSVPALAHDVLLLAPSAGDESLADAVAGALVRHGARVRSHGAQSPDLVIALPGAEPVAEEGVPRWALVDGDGATPHCDHVVTLPKEFDVPARRRLCSAIAEGRRETRIEPDGMFVREYELLGRTGVWRPEGHVLVAGPADELTRATVDAVLGSGARCLVAGGAESTPETLEFGTAEGSTRLTAAIVRAGSGFEDATAPLVAVVSVGEHVDSTPRAPGTALAVAVHPDLDPRDAVTGLWRAMSTEETAVRLVGASHATQAAPVAEPARSAPEPDPGPAPRPDPHPEPQLRPEPDSGTPDVGAELLTSLAALPPEDWAEAVLDGLQRLSAAVLGYESASEIGAEDEFFDLGLTSVTALELRDHLTRLTDLEWPADLLYEYPTPRELADVVVTRLKADPA